MHIVDTVERMVPKFRDLWRSGAQAPGGRCRWKIDFEILFTGVLDGARVCAFDNQVPTSLLGNETQKLPGDQAHMQEMEAIPIATGFLLESEGMHKSTEVFPCFSPLTCSSSILTLDSCLHTWPRSSDMARRN